MSPRDSTEQAETRSPSRGKTDDDVEGPPEFDEGRYLYCVVDVGENEDSFDRMKDEDEPVSIDATGVEDEPISLVTVDQVGAVVHSCDGVYDSGDLTQIHRWLVDHQSVIDDMADRFGTPLPFQFDTIVRGDDAVLERWLRKEYDEILKTLETLSGHWEYRIEVVRTDPIEPARLEEGDDELSSLRQEIERASEGTAFLLEKRYDRRVEALRQGRRESFASNLIDRLADHAREVHELERSPRMEVADSSGGRTDDHETVCRLTALAHEDREGKIGSVLNDIAAEPGLEVRFTGPWPPYTFVPDLGGEPDDGDDEQWTEANGGDG